MRKIASIGLAMSLFSPLMATGQQFYLDMRVAVVDDNGNGIEETVFLAPLLEEALYVSTVRTLPPPNGSVLIEAVAEASLIMGTLHIRDNCNYTGVSQNCASRAHWKDKLSFDATGLPMGTTFNVNVEARVTGTYGPAAGTGYTIFAQSADTIAVIDTLRADVSYWNSTTTGTNDPNGFTVLNTQGSWNVVGPEVFSGQVQLKGGVVNSLDVQALFNGDTDRDLHATFRISNDAGLGYTSASGVFLSDLDGDGVVNGSDNCVEHANADQRDTDSDNFGNRCDPDLNNDGTVNFVDLQLLRGVFFSSDDNADFDGDGGVNFADLQIMRDFLFGPPGPTGL